MQDHRQSLAGKIVPLLPASGASAYAQQRIKESFAGIASVLASAEPIQKFAAIDIGCGAGFDTFALAGHFEQVLGVDADAKAIREARQIARLVPTSNIAFAQASIDTWIPPAQYDFALCNLMSHNVASRVHLIQAIARMLKHRGVAVYSDECEGYAPLEIHRAITRKDNRALISRLQQLLYGFVGGAGFRFFAAGSARPIFEDLGCEIAHEKRSLWNGVATTDFLIVRSPRGGSAAIPARAASQDRDYASLTGDFAYLRTLVAETLRTRPALGLSPLARGELRKRARNDPNPYAPYLLHLAMADLVMPQILLAPRGFMARFGGRLENAASRLPKALERTGLKALSVAGLGSLGKDFSWDAVSELDREFIEIVRERAGLEDGIED